MSTDPRSQGTIATNQEEISRLRQLIMGFRITQLIYVAAKLGLADHLARKPQTARDLAPLVDAEPRALYRLCVLSRAWACLQSPVAACSR